MKKTNMISCALLLICLMGLTKVMAQNFTVDGMNYSIHSDGITVTLLGYAFNSSATGSLTIPSLVSHITYETVNGQQVAVTHTYTVTRIGIEAFKSCSRLTGSLTIPNSVKEIGDYAFYGCSGFTGS